MSSKPVNASTESRLWAGGQAFFRRILLHFGALIAACALPLPGFITTSSFEIGLRFSIYLGLICLFPQGEIRSHSWRISVCTGLIQAVFLLALGMHWAGIFMWAGLQGWFQRLVQRRGSMGLEWLPLCLMIFCLSEGNPYLLHSLYPAWAFFKFLPAFILDYPFISFVPIAILGFFVIELWSRVRAKAIYKQRLQIVVTKIRKVVTARSLPEQIQSRAELVYRQATEYFGFKEVDRDEAMLLTERLETLSDKLKVFANTRTGIEKGWSQELFRAPKWMRRPIDENEVSIGKDLDSVSLLFTKALKAGRVRNGTEDGIESRLSGYEETAHALLARKDRLPADLALHVEHIVDSTFSILKNMRTDPQDLRPGDKFLNRYLTATSHIIDEYLRLRTENIKQETFQKSGELLACLEKAFADEHKALLQNDVVNFTAELGALENLIKMRGGN